MSNNKDIKYMKLAYKLAVKAYNKGEIPIGAVLTRNNKVISMDYNRCQNTKNPLLHSEFLVITKALEKTGDYRLTNCTLYVTIEPCVFCCGAILLSRISKVVYGAKNEKFGAVKSNFSTLSNKNLNHECEVVNGILEKECSQLITDFFKSKR